MCGSMIWFGIEIAMPTPWMNWICFSMNKQFECILAKIGGAQNEKTNVEEQSRKMNKRHGIQDSTNETKSA